MPSHDTFQEFIATCGALELALNRLARTKRLAFGIALNRARKDPRVERRYADLEMILRVRNLVAHNGQYALPAPRVNRLAKRVLGELQGYKDAYHYASAVRTFDVGHPLSEALREMVQDDISQAPVTRGRAYSGMLTTNGIARWLAHEFKENAGSALLTENSVADAVEHAEGFEVPRFVARDLSSAEAVAILTGETEPDQAPPIALLFTRQGQPDQEILRILVRADVPTIQQELVPYP